MTEPPIKKNYQPSWSLLRVLFKCGRQRCRNQQLNPEGPTQAKVQDKTLAMPKSPIFKAPKCFRDTTRSPIRIKTRVIIAKTQKKHISTATPNILQPESFHHNTTNTPETGLFVFFLRRPSFFPTVGNKEISRFQITMKHMPWLTAFLLYLHANVAANPLNNRNMFDTHPTPKKKYIIYCRAIFFRPFLAGKCWRKKTKHPWQLSKTQKNTKALPKQKNKSEKKTHTRLLWRFLLFHLFRCFHWINSSYLGKMNFMSWGRILERSIFLCSPKER